MYEGDGGVPLNLDQRRRKYRTLTWQIWKRTTQSRSQKRPSIPGVGVQRGRCVRTKVERCGARDRNWVRADAGGRLRLSLGRRGYRHVSGGHGICGELVNVLPKNWESMLARSVRTDPVTRFPISFSRPQNPVFSVHGNWVHGVFFFFWRLVPVCQLRETRNMSARPCRLRHGWK